MDKWLSWLLVTAVGLPLLMFVGNLGAETLESVNEASVDDAGLALVSPELFLGYAQANAKLGNEEGSKPGEAVAYTPPSSYESIVPNVAYLGGVWGNDYENLELLSMEGRIVVKYTGKSVDVIAAPGAESALMQAVLDGALADSSNSGSDMLNSMAIISGHRKYSLISEGFLRLICWERA